VIYLAANNCIYFEEHFHRVAAVLLSHIIPSILHMVKWPASVPTEKWLKLGMVRLVLGVVLWPQLVWAKMVATA
jgi:hypothetical protein